MSREKLSKTIKELKKITKKLDDIVSGKFTATAKEIDILEKRVIELSKGV